MNNQTEPELNPSATELRLAGILDALREPVLGLDEMNRVVFLNRAAAARFGCAEADSPGRLADQCPALLETISQLNLKELRALPGLSRETRTLELRVPHAGHDPSWMRAAVQVMDAGSGRWVVLLLQDLAQQRQDELALNRAWQTRAIAALADGVAHDFNNVFTAILSHLDLVLHAPELPDTLKEYVMHARHSAHRGADLVSRLTSFSHCPAPAFTRLNLVRMVQRIMASLRPDLPENIRIRLPQNEADIPEVPADEGQISQVLASLVANARAAMPQGGDLVIQLEEVALAEALVHPPRQAGRFVKLTVAHSGSGLAREGLDQPHAPFLPPQVLSKGQGLGLSIASNMITAHGGWMEFAGRPGPGSEVAIFLPGPREEGAPASEVPAVPLETTPTDAGGTETILVIDDEAAVRWVIKAVLSYRGYRIVEAANGEEAVRKFRQGPGEFDLILLDMHMPGLDGWETLTQLRAVDSQRPVILLSGVRIEEQAARLARERSVTFLAKPFDNQELTRLVRRTLDARRSPG